MGKRKAFLATSLVLLLLGMATWGCGPAEAPTATPTFTSQPTLALPLSKYEGAYVSTMYPAGWGEINEFPGRLWINEPSRCAIILVFWATPDTYIPQSAEARYRSAREAGYSSILEGRGDEPEFEILHEYRLGDAPVFEYQYRDEQDDCLRNVQVMDRIDPETRQYVRAVWEVSDYCGTDKWHQEMNSRRALFETVMQSITFE